MNRLESSDTPFLFDQLSRRISEVVQSNGPLVFAVDLEQTLFEPFRRGVDFINELPAPSQNLTDFLRQIVLHPGVCSRARQILVANASRMVVDPNSMFGLDYTFARSYIAAGEAVLAEIGRVVPLTELAKHGDQGTIIHINDLAIYPALARCSPSGWSTFATTVLPYNDRHHKPRYEDYLAKMIATFNVVDLDQILAQETRERAALLRSFR